MLQNLALDEKDQEEELGNNRQIENISLAKKYKVDLYRIGNKDENYNKGRINMGVNQNKT